MARLPTASRDLALVLPAAVAYADVRRVLEQVEAPAPVAFAVIDRYVGPPLGEDQVSITVRLTLTPTERTLVDQATDGYRLALVAALERELGGEIRG